jgi:hypothetical protein
MTQEPVCIFSNRIESLYTVSTAYRWLAASMRMSIYIRPIREAGAIIHARTISRAAKLALPAMEVDSGSILAAYSSDASMLITIAIVLFVFTVSAVSRRGGGKLPPSPPAFPLLGHLHLLRPPPHQAFHRLVGRYGPLVHLRGGRPRPPQA